MIVYNDKFYQEYIDFILNDGGELSDEEYGKKYDILFNAYLDYISDIRDIILDYFLKIPKYYNNKDLENMELLGYLKLGANKCVEFEKLFKEGGMLNSSNSSDLRGDMIKLTNRIIETLKILINTYNKLYSALGSIQ
jgi:hypothetical protein